MATLALRTIDKCIKDVLPILLHQVIDVSEDTAIQMSASAYLLSK